MRNIIQIFLVIISILSALMTSAVLGNEELQYVLIEIDNHDQVYELNDFGVNIETVKGNQVRAWVTEEQRARLIAAGCKVSSLEQELREFEERYRRMLLDDLGEYHTYAEQTGYLHTIAATYPGITHLDSIGPSIEGRWIWALKITDNPLIDEDEPEFCYFATMHGDEPPGTEMCLNLIDLLVTGYGTWDTATNFINNYELWILPLINPDGYVHAQRRNMNSVDLNRNYPVPDGTIGGDGSYVIQPETQAIIDFLNERYIVLAANYHTGALVANYPWDYTSVRHPDDTLYIEISLGYSSRNTPMWNSPDYEHGITNGYDWYEADGTLQDWGVYFRRQLHITLEISILKWPAESALDGLWDDNRDAMLHMITWANRGVRGIVTDSITGDPLGAEVNVLDIDFYVACDPSIGDYHRPLLPGTYTLEFSEPGYHTKTISGVTVGAGAPTRLDVQLRSYGVSTITGHAFLAGESVHNGILVNAEYDTFLSSDTTNASGYYNISGLFADVLYTVTASKDGWKDSSVTITPTEGAFDTVDFTLYPYDTLYFSDFEADNGGFYSYGPVNDWEWGTPTTGPGNAYSGVNAWATKLNSDYNNESQSHLALDLDLTTVESAVVFFMSWYKFQPYYILGYHDGGNIKVSVGGGSAILVYPAGGYDETLSGYNWLIPEEEAFADNDRGNFWHTEEVDLTPYCGNNITLLFEFGSSSSTTDDGWYIDDVLVTFVNYTLIVDSRGSEIKPSDFEILSNHPNPFNASTRISLRITKECLTNISIYDILGNQVWEKGETLLSPGEHTILWNAEDENNEQLPTGVYLCVIETENSRDLIKMLLVR
ncbi:carboxypeptidase regulatory-like domain-containing protein [bacterium]|nr:carboxypeptidase regulatory-like domain-containing protein [bacterium]